MSVWRRWCRLCANANENNCSAFSQLEHSKIDSTLATAIGKYFWVNIRMDDQIPKVVCTQCHTLVTSLVAFTERVNKVQDLFCILQNSKASDANQALELRSQLPGDWEHIIVGKKEEEEAKVNELSIKIIDEDVDTEAEVEAEYKEEEEDDEEDEEEDQQLEEETGVTAIQKICQEKYKNIFEDKAELSEECDEYIDSEENFEEGVEENDEDEDEEVYIFAEEDAEITRVKNEKSENSYEENTADQEEVEEEDFKAQVELLDEDAKSADDDQVDDSDLFKELKFKVVPNVDEKPSGSSSSATPPVQVYTGKRGRPCKQPGQPSSKNVRKRRKIESENDVHKYICSVCKKPYKNATSYRKHMSEAHEMTSDLPHFACSDCGRLFATERMRNVHERTHLPLEAKCDIPCPFCEKKFSKITVMRQHVSGVHHQLKPFICDECGRALKTLAALNEHKLVHTDDCPYECEVCQARFKNKPRLKIHMDTHSENPYVCSECGKKLNTRRTLKMHMLVHTEEKTLKCDFCNASFKRAKALKNHLILHTGLRPYTCNFCDKTFSNGSNCRSHKKKLHPQELEEEEAQGIKNNPIITPKLDELRASTVVVTTPRQVKRHTGGLPPAMRALLLAAEERAKNAEPTPAENSSNQIEYTMVNEDDEDDEEEFVYEIIDEI